MSQRLWGNYISTGCGGWGGGQRRLAIVCQIGHTVNPGLPKGDFPFPAWLPIVLFRF